MICRNTYNKKFCRLMIPCKAMTKLLYRNSEKSFLECTKKGLRNIFRHSFHSIFFMFVLLIRNHTVVLVQFGINLHLWVFQQVEIALTEAARAISAFWKTHSCKLIPNWTRNRMITYTNPPQLCFLGTSLYPLRIIEQCNLVIHFRREFTVKLSEAYPSRLH